MCIRIALSSVLGLRIHIVEIHMGTFLAVVSHVCVQSLHLV